MFKRKPKALTPEELEVVHTKDFFDMIRALKRQVR